MALVIEKPLIFGIPESEFTLKGFPEGIAYVTVDQSDFLRITIDTKEGRIAFAGQWEDESKQTVIPGGRIACDPAKITQRYNGELLRF